MTIRVEVPPDAIVIRFSPTDPERVLRRAERAARHSGVHSLSVFLDTRQDGETESDTIARLLAASELSGIRPGNNAKYYVCARAGVLLDQGFMFVKDGYEGELAEHYSVDLGPTPTVEAAERFVRAFGQVRRR